MLMANDTGSEQRERSYLQLFAKQQVSGVIIAPVGNVEAELSRMRAIGIASVLSARRAESPAQASVSIDHVASGRLAAAHLIEQGRKRIGFVSSSLKLKQVADRLNGALSAVHAAPGVTLEVIPVPERSVEAGIACAEALVRRPATERPDALFCANDLLAIGVVQAFVAGRTFMPLSRPTSPWGSRVRRHRIRSVHDRAADHDQHSASGAGDRRGGLALL